MQKNYKLLGDTFYSPKLYIMRLLFLLLSLVLSLSVTYGQHIKFMGTEVTGNYESFKDSLTLKGFTYVDSFETLHKFYGKFANELIIGDRFIAPKE